MSAPSRIAVFVLTPLLLGPVRADHALGEKLGTVRFELAADAGTREHVVRGVKLLHHMMYDEADREFSAALAADAKCVWADWGRAMALVHPLWPDVPDAAGLQRGIDLVQ